MIWLWIWVAVFVISAIVEAFSLDLTSIWITCGAIIPFIIAIFAPEAIIWQIIVFIVVTLVLMIFIRPIAKKCLTKRTHKTNISSFIGKKAILISDITPYELGTIKINDIVWNVTTKDNSTISANNEVEIIEVNGNKLIVKLVEEN